MLSFKAAISHCWAAFTVRWLVYGLAAWICLVGWLPGITSTPLDCSMFQLVYTTEPE